MTMTATLTCRPPAPRSTAGGRSGRIGRRGFLRGAGATAAASTAWLTGCTGSGEVTAPSGDGGPATGTVLMWDHLRPLTELFTTELFPQFERDHPGVTIDRREMVATAMGQALQLGRRSNQLPDLHTLAGIDGSPPSLQGAGWFQPIDGFVDVASSPAAESLTDGVHRFDGSTYTVPVYTNKWHDLIPWLNTVLIEQAGLDPSAGAADWDGFTAALRTLRAADAESHPLVIAAKDPGYLSTLLDRLATAAGGVGAIDPRTGAYCYADEPYLTAMEALVSWQRDGLIHPSAVGLDTRDARTRWEVGEAAVYLWGPWFVGGVMVDQPQAIERGLGVWQVPTADGSPPSLYSPPENGLYWVSSQAEHARLAAQLMMAMVQPEFQRQLAGAMVRPPALPGLVAEADVHPAYRRCVELMEQCVHTAPAPQSRNPAVSAVLAEMRPVTPGLGQIVQAALGEPDADWRGALLTYRDAITTERDRAIAAVAGGGRPVSQQDWVSEGWTPGQDA